MKSPRLGTVSFELEDFKAFFVVYSFEIQSPTHHLRKLLKKKKKNTTPQGASRFYLLLIYAAFSNRAIPAGVTALWRSLGAILPA